MFSPCVLLFSFFQQVYLFMATYGFGGLAAALAVGIKWCAPREPPLGDAVAGLRGEHLPTLYVLCSVIAWALGLTPAGRDMPFVIVGTYGGWWYLRFVHRWFLALAAPDCLGNEQSATGVFPNKGASFFVIRFKFTCRGGCDC